MNISDLHIAALAGGLYALLLFRVFVLGWNIVDLVMDARRAD